MSPFIEKAFIAALAVVTVLSFGWAGKISVSLSSAAALETGGKPNVLVISICSMRKDLFAAYGNMGESIMPAADRFFSQSSVIFDNAFNGVPWISFISFMEKYFPLMTLQGVLSASPYWDVPYIRIPLQKAQQDGAVAEEVNDSEFEKDYKAFAELVKQQILLPRTAPFMLITHIKYLHYPLIDKFNPESQWDFYLNDREKAQVAEYLAHPERYFVKLPLLLMLTSDPKYALQHPDIARSVTKRDPASLRALTGLVSNEKFLQEWKISPNYEGDLEILKKAYRGNARYMDKYILEPMFNLYGDKKLRDNTVVLLAGDHGEMHMERDELTHANSAYDQALAIPAALRFPHDWRSKIRVKSAMHIHRLADLIEGVLNGDVARENVEEKITSLTEDVFVIRDCRNTIRGLRFKNKYKYFVDEASGERHLFDLESDPAELVNRSADQPEVADQMEALYWANIDRFKWIPPYRCQPW